MYKDKKAMVIGAGVMGSGIAQVYATQNIIVYLVDQNKEMLKKAEEIIEGNIINLINEGMATKEDLEAAKKNIIFISSEELEKIAEEVDIVVESVSENPDIKRSVFQQLDKYCRADCIICSNTSGSNVFEIGNISNPERFLITHWFNPPYLMELVEVVAGPHTSKETIDFVMGLHKFLGKKPVFISQFIPGFVVNRLATALMREASHMVLQGWTTPEDIDEAIRATNGVRYSFEGPMALYDVVGWDLVYNVSVDVHKSLYNGSDEGNLLAKKYIEEGRLGVKSGAGAFEYNNEEPGEFMKKRAVKLLESYKAINGHS